MRSLTDLAMFLLFGFLGIITLVDGELSSSYRGLYVKGVSAKIIAFCFLLICIKSGISLVKSAKKNK